MVKTQMQNEWQALSSENGNVKWKQIDLQRN